MLVTSSSATHLRRGLGNLAIGIRRRRGHRNVAAALRGTARDTTRVLPLLDTTSS